LHEGSEEPAGPQPIPAPAGTIAGAEGQVGE